MTTSVHNIHYVSPNGYELHKLRSYAIVTPRMMNIAVRQQLYLLASVLKNRWISSMKGMLHNIKAILTNPLNPVI